MLAEGVEIKRELVIGIILTLLLTSMLTLAFNIEPVSATDSPYIAVIPASTVEPALTPGMNYTISINTDYNGDDVWGFQFKLTFSPNVLEGIEVVNGDLITEDVGTTIWNPGTFDNNAGTLSYTGSIFFKIGLPKPVTSGPGTLANITFRVIGRGISDITLETQGSERTILMGYTEGGHGNQYNIIDPETMPDQIQHGFFDNRLQIVIATLDIDPDRLNLKSRGRWITAYIQLPEGYDPEGIDAATILLNETIAPILDPKYDFVTNSSEYLIDYDSDGILERMVKFSRAEVAEYITSVLGVEYGNVTLTIAGELYDGTQFEGTCQIKVLFPGDADDDGDVDFDDFAILAGCYGMSIENPSFNPLADFDEDGYVKYDDFLILAGNYGKTAS